MLYVLCAIIKFKIITELDEIETVKNANSWLAELYSIINAPLKQIYFLSVSLFV